MFKNQKMLCEKTLQLTEFLNKHKHLPAQGTKEWLDNKKFKIGGSEISTILGKNIYQDVKKLLKLHVGLDHFPSFFALHWGTLLEDCIRLYMCDKFKCDIVETGSIPHEKYDSISFSPDGLAVIENNLLKKYLNIDFPEDKKSIILFEFKCPYSRLPNGEVPHHYIDQPKLGMETIDIIDSSIFVEAVYKICSLNDIIYTNNYNKNYHIKDDMKNVVFTNPHAYSVLVLYGEKITSIDDLYDNVDLADLITDLEKNCSKITLNNKKNIYDIGSIRNIPLVNKILKLCACKNNKILNVDYSIRGIYSDEYKNHKNKHFYDYNTIAYTKYMIQNTINKIEKQNKMPIAIFPCKLMDININHIEKETILHDDIIDKLNSVINTIKQCEKLTNIQQKELISNFKL